MTPPIRLLLVLHNHQPVGNFDGVFEQAYRDSYQRFLDVFESYPQLRMALHVSGPLMEWLDGRHPEYVDRLAGLVAAGRIEIVGGAFYEPILTIIPPTDRRGQITRYTQWLNNRLGAEITGMWLPERVWEPALAEDLAESGIQYTVLDDFHFNNAGLAPEELYGYYATEENGRMLFVFPGSERLRYLIPFGSAQQTIDYLGDIAHRQPGSVVVFADDGEKFGTWPETQKHIYDEGWLTGFFDTLVANESWLKVTTPQEALQNVPPLGKVYLPEASYREMTEWALPVERALKLDAMRRDLEHDPRWPTIASFVRGGFWRNFRRKYPEADEMASRMLLVSRRVAAAEADGADPQRVDAARMQLYRGQCNCSYWHGAFGGIYLPHLRHAVYHHLIAADNLLDQAAGRVTQAGEPNWVEATSDDLNCDSRPEVRLANDKLIAFFAPAAGGALYELDVREICHNLLATLARRPEAYHAKVLAGRRDGHDDVASIHDRVHFKQEGLDQKLQYDWHLRKSLLDHFYAPDAQTTLAAVSSGEAEEVGDFVSGPYVARLRRNPDRVQVLLTRAGHVSGQPLTITKGVTLDAGSGQLEVGYLLEGIPQGKSLHFGVELNFSGLPADLEDRFFHDGHQQRLGHLGTSLDLNDCRTLGLTDQWLGIDLGISIDRPSGMWVFPIHTVSQSEGGFELVHQSVVVQPHWRVQADQHGRWSTTIRIAVETTKTSAGRPSDVLATAGS